MNVVELLTQANIKFEPKEEDHVYIECQQCGKDNLSINLFTGAWHCWSLGCEDVKGGFHKLAGMLNFSSAQFTPVNAPVKTKIFSDDERLAIENAKNNKPEIIEWAVSRSLDPDFVMKQGVGYDPDKKAIVFPYRDEKGNLVGARYRSTLYKTQWTVGREPDLYVLDYNDLNAAKLIIVEGEVDELTIKQMGLPCVAILGSRKDNGYQMLRRVRQIYLGYDMDGAGEAGVEKAATLLGRYRCKRIAWTEKDPNDMLQAGAERGDFLECLREAKTLATDLKSKNGADLLKDYMQQQEQPIKRLSWGYPRLDSFTKGIIPGVVGVLAEAGTGKSTTMYNIAANNVNAGVNVGIAGYEEHNRDEAIPKMTAILVGRNPGGGKFDKQEVDLVQKEVGRLQFYDGDETIDDFCEWVKECYYVHDVRLILVDYLQLMVADESDREQLKKDCYKVKKLTKELQGLSIVEIIQPKQVQKFLNKDKQMTKNEDLDGSDARGGSVINQSVDAMLVMKPVKGYPDMVQLQYTKVRGGLRVSKKDWLGQITQLVYDHATLRQTEAQHLNYGG